MNLVGGHNSTNDARRGLGCAHLPASQVASLVADCPLGPSTFFPATGREEEHVTGQVHPADGDNPSQAEPQVGVGGLSSHQALACLCDSARAPYGLCCLVSERRGPDFCPGCHEEQMDDMMVTRASRTVHGAHDTRPDQTITGSLESRVPALP